MRDTVEWLAAEADESEELSGDQNPRLVSAKSAETRTGHPEKSEDVQEDQNPEVEVVAEYATRLENDCDYENERVRRIYRARVVTMLRRYLQYSIETGRLPSVIGREVFRAKITTYTATTFEDRVIFVHDIERCLERLSSFDQEIIARLVLQEYDHVRAARILHCTRRTIERRLPEILDELSEEFLKSRLLVPLPQAKEKTE